MAVADPVALRQGAVEQNVVGVGLAQGAQQAGRAFGEQVNDGCRVGVGGADGDAEARGDLREGVAFRSRGLSSFASSLRTPWARRAKGENRSPNPVPRQTICDGWDTFTVTAAGVLDGGFKAGFARSR